MVDQSFEVVKTATDKQKLIELSIDGQDVVVPAGSTILDAATKIGIRIPTLCFLKDLNEIGACRVCVVEIEGIDQLVSACNNHVLEGMVVKTNSPKVREARRTVVEMILSQHDGECASCVRSGNCSLQSLANDLGICWLPYKKELTHSTWDMGFPLIRDNDKCIKCMRCIQVCDKIQASHVWDITSRATHTQVDVAHGKSIRETNCTVCGQCITHCPTGALRERDDTQRAFSALADERKVVIAQIAPSVRTSWGEAFGLKPDEATNERLVAALRLMGFDYIFNTDFSADLTIMEEGSELIERLREPAVHRYPLFTSCCPAWVRFVKSHYPELVGSLSTSKSPMEMFGSIIKTYYAELHSIDPKNIFSVSIMPCIAKKAEAELPSMVDAEGIPYVDLSLSVREIDRMIKADHISVSALKETPFDVPFSNGSGAGIIFGTTGRVMEAACRTAYFLTTGQTPKNDMFRAVRGPQGWKEASFELAGRSLRVAATSGLAHAKALCDQLIKGQVSYDFVEVMACPGGCAGGGGQPIHDGCELAEQRGKQLYGLDRVAPYRNSYENPAILSCYREYLDKPLSSRAEELLHTDHTGWQIPM